MRFSFEKKTGGLSVITPKHNPYSSPQKTVSKVFTRLLKSGFSDDDPSAGSPTETLLRLLLPLNNQV